MSFFSRFLGTSGDDRAAMRPLWHRIVEVARERQWYADCGIADTVPGRFDVITLVLALVLLRFESEPGAASESAHNSALAEPSVRLTELFVEDMDGQLRQSGVGDLVVGKQVGQLMGVLGGRLGALREALADNDDVALSEALSRNISLIDGADTAQVAAAARQLANELAAQPASTLLAGVIQR